MVYFLALNETYWAKQGKGAFKDGEKLPLKTAEQCERYKVVVSRSQISDETKVFIDAIETPKKLISIWS